MSVSATVAHIRFGYSTPYSVFNELYHGVRILSREMPKNTVRGEKCAGGAPWARVRSCRGRFPRCAVFPSVASEGDVRTGAQLSWAVSEVRSFSERSFRGRRAHRCVAIVGRRGHGYLTPRHRNETDGGGAASCAVILLQRGEAKTAAFGGCFHYPITQVRIVRTIYASASVLASASASSASSSSSDVQ